VGALRDDSSDGTWSIFLNLSHRVREHFELGRRRRRRPLRGGVGSRSALLEVLGKAGKFLLGEHRRRGRGPTDFELLKVLQHLLCLAEKMTMDETSKEEQRRGRTWR